jgi:outer membrane protein assembly factor BamB
MKKIFSLLPLYSLFFLTSCTTISGIGEDNTPAPSALVNYQAEILPHLVWSHNIETKKTVSIFNLSNGQVFWNSSLKQTLVAGPSIGNNLVVAGDNNGGVWALALDSGQTIWHVTLSDPIVSSPVISDKSIFVRTLDGTVWALNNSNGSILWKAADNTPTMVLSGGSKPILIGSNIIVGSTNGTLTAYSLQTGAVKWQSTIARPQGVADVEKMVDIVANPKLTDNMIYIVTYQGNLAALNSQTGRIIWQTPMSSYTGLAVSAQAIFVTDANGVVWAFNRTTGKQMWKQEYLQYRHLTAPAIMGNTIVIADSEGYVHWLSQSSGQTLSRIQVSSSSIVSTPVVHGNQVYILSSNGLVSDYSY